jgi:hypothetical protein
MAGCSNCKGKSGCDQRKDHMFAELGHTLARLYPNRRWGVPDDSARFGAGICADEGELLGEELARALDAATFFRAGDEEEYCNYLYVLCMGREPCLVQVRDGGVPIPAEVSADNELRELYLRVCLSDMARLAAVQEVRLELIPLGTGSAATTHGSGEISATPRRWAVREVPRAGVYDAPLLRRLQRLVAILPAYDILHVDFGEISAPLAEFAPGDYAARYGGEPALANFLFYPQPVTMPTLTVL